MREGVKDHWVEALRSDRFKQARGQFTYLAFEGNETTRHDCCLSVLAHLAAEDGVEGLEWKGDEVYWTDPEDGSRSITNDGGLPPTVWEWAGVDTSDPDIGGHTAIERNDSMQQSFSEIADAIEADPNL